MTYAFAPLWPIPLLLALPETEEELREYHHLVNRRLHSQKNHIDFETLSPCFRDKHVSIAAQAKNPLVKQF